jgi:hypothetical protein
MGYIPAQPPSSLLDKSDTGCPPSQRAVPAVPVGTDSGSSTTQITSSAESERIPPKKAPVKEKQREELARRFWRQRDGTYEDRAHNALDAMREIPAAKGLIVWLGEHDPPLYQKLTQLLPNKISRAWDARVPYGDFDALCRELVDTYAFAAERYRRDVEK